MLVDRLRDAPLPLALTTSSSPSHRHTVRPCRYHEDRFLAPFLVQEGVERDNELLKPRAQTFDMHSFVHTWKGVFHIISGEQKLQHSVSEAIAVFEYLERVSVYSIYRPNYCRIFPAGRPREV